jgi:hypothetical protein
MKIYDCPTQVPPPKIDYSKNFDYDKCQADEKAHELRLKEWIKANGYPGKYSGEIYSEQIADGYAQYMVCDGRSFSLVHLPYGDGYQSRDIQFLPKKEIIRRIEAEKKFNEIFTKSA